MSYIMPFIRHVRVLCHKELLSIIKDPRTRTILIAPVIMQGFLFGYAASYNLENIPYAMIDESHSSESRKLAEHFAGSSCFVCVKSLDSSSELPDYMDSGEVMMAVIIPSNFEEKLLHGESAPVQVIADGRNSSAAGIAVGYAGKVIASFNKGKISRGAAVTIEERSWYNPQLSTRWNFLPGLIAMISFVQVIMLSGLSIAREREQGTFDQLLVTPLSSSEILTGKALPPVLIGLLQSTLLFCIAYFWFEIPFAGSLMSLYLMLLVFNISSTGIGLSLSAVSANMQQVLVYVLVLLIPMCLLSGVATPVKNMPEVLQMFTYADPLRFAIDGVRRIYLEGAEVMELWLDFVPLFVIIALTMPLSAWLFRQRSS